MRLTRIGVFLISFLLLLGTLHDPVITYADKQDLSEFVKRLNTHYVKVSVLSPKIVVVELDTSYFYNYKGLYLITDHILRWMAFEFDNVLGKLIQIVNVSITWMERIKPIQVTLTENLELKVKKNYSLIRPLTSIGVYPVEYRIHRKSGILVAFVSSNSTRGLYNVSEDLLSSIALKLGIRNYSLAIIIKRLTRDPVFDIAFREYPVRIWDKVEEYIRNYLNENNNMVGNQTIYYDWCFEGIFVPADNLLLRTEDIDVSNAFFQFCIPVKYREKVLYANISYIVSNKELFNTLAPYLDLITMAFKKLGLDYHGTIVDLLNIRVREALSRNTGSPYNALQTGETTHGYSGITQTTIEPNTNTVDEEYVVTSLPIVIAVIAIVSLVTIFYKLRLMK